ncbi:MAG: uracil-DNA glycosylase [Ignavibacteria bacterium]|nr:uracil-DNA glycosylase [Ignavibacteria bacterium]
MKCGLGKLRNNFVFGVGNPNADVVVIGEAPGADEDAQGEPFVGRAGQLLNKILEATGFKREEVFILNILKCRPPGNRNPAPDEAELCRPYLEKQLKLINPKLLLLLGKVASETLLKTKEPLNKLRGKVHDYKGWKLMITFHPAALLRNPNWKRPTWEDMQQFKALYEEMTGKKLETEKNI